MERELGRTENDALDESWDLRLCHGDVPLCRDRECGLGRRLKGSEEKGAVDGHDRVSQGLAPYRFPIEMAPPQGWRREQQRNGAGNPPAH